MTNVKPPEWSDDPVSKFIKDAQFNERVSALNLPSAFDGLQVIDGLFRSVERAIESDIHEELLVPGMLVVRCHSAFLAGARLAMSGQWVESSPILRSMIEIAWYALHIARAPNPSEQAAIWLNRNDSVPDKRRCKSEFLVKKIYTTHEVADRERAKELHRLYEVLIDFGAHPNQLGVMAVTSKSEADSKTQFMVGIVHAEPHRIRFVLDLAIRAAVGALRIFQLIFPERYAIIGIDRKLNRAAKRFAIVLKTNFGN